MTSSRNNRKKLGDVLAEIVADREAVLLIENEEARQVKAVDTLYKAMSFVKKLLGDDLLNEALGTVDEDDPVDVLKVVSARLIIYASLFKDIPRDAASPLRVVEEAAAIAHGDQPNMFAKLKGNGKSKKDRELRLKLRAIVWDTYLKGRGMSATDRAYVIGKAYGTDWSVISTSWRRDIKNYFDIYFIEYSIDIGERAAIGGSPNWETVEVAAARARDPAGTEKLQDWEVAMKLDASQLQEARRMRPVSQQ